MAEPAPPPPGNTGALVPQLVGRWLGRAEVFTHYTFTPDGKVTRTLQIGSTGYSGHTVYSDGPAEHGTASQDGDVLVLTWDALSFTTGPNSERYRVGWIDYIDYKHTPELTMIGCQPNNNHECTLLLTKLE